MSYFLHGVEFVPLTDTSEINHRVEEMKKVKKKQFSMEDKLMDLRCIASIIATVDENV